MAQQGQGLHFISLLRNFYIVEEKAVQVGEAGRRLVGCVFRALAGLWTPTWDDGPRRAKPYNSSGWAFGE